jgi:photosynthetic reaction center H subunit
MPPGAITDYIDVPQLAFWAFFLFFIGLVVYLRREDRREGYPLVDPADRGRSNRSAPAPKLFTLLTGGRTSAPHHFPQPPIKAEPPRIWTGNRLSPIGNPLLSAVGPAAYAMRSDQPFLHPDRDPELQPLRVATLWHVVPGDSDPRGMAVVDARYVAVGSVVDLWVDRETRLLRYLEVQLSATPRTVLVPIYASVIRPRRREVQVRDLLAGQFASVPVLAHPDQISAREEDQVNAYYAGGGFYNRENGFAAAFTDLTGAGR